ncbi:unnamed protein product [Heligmosomoides polygyrus]|uniref:Uncharacterized protein n=1 Tax=Heligmosomoides polygyrus TaxID=6339 RepID=A0A183GJE8_HELPZ|nr:unnamed protein product [Heligmosomoides polygyrus]
MEIRRNRTIDITTMKQHLYHAPPKPRVEFLACRDPGFLDDSDRDNFADVGFLDDSDNGNFADTGFLDDSGRVSRIGYPKMIHSDPIVAPGVDEHWQEILQVLGSHPVGTGCCTFLHRRDGVLDLGREERRDGTSVLRKMAWGRWS